MQSRILKIPKNANAFPISELIDYELFCNPSKKSSREIKEISVKEFLELQTNKVAFQLIDVREKEEYLLKNLAGNLIPLSEIEQHIDEISKGKMVIIHCQSGQRSQKAIQLLQEKYGFNNLINLRGGLNAFH